MLNSKELLDRTGISRATLNNYIGWGIVPKPEVLPPAPQDGAAPRIGYFPDEVVARIAEIQRLKSQGWSMKTIAGHFAPPGKDQPAPFSVGRPATAAVPSPPEVAPAAGRPQPAAGPSKRLARLTQAAVLAADLEDPTRIWAELPAEEYFELVDQVWQAAEPIFRRRHGIQGKHPADGLVCYFLPRPDGGSHLWNALIAAHELRQAMHRISKDWQLRKGWSRELFLNAGIDEGQEWIGTQGSAGHLEFTMLGATLNRAVGVAAFGRHGAIWVSKSALGNLAPAERQHLKFGVRRRDEAGNETFVGSVFSTAADLRGPDGVPKCIARLPVTEIVDFGAIEKRRERELDQRPA